MFFYALKDIFFCLIETPIFKTSEHLKSHTYNQCNKFNEQTKQKEEEIAEINFNENLSI